MNKYFLFFLTILASFNIYSMLIEKEAISKKDRQNCLNKLPKEMFLKISDHIAFPIQFGENPSANEVSERIKGYDLNIKGLDSFLQACKKMYMGSYLEGDSLSKVCKKMHSVIKKLKCTRKKRKEEYCAAIKCLAKIGGIKDLNSCKELDDKQIEFVFKYPVLLFYLTNFTELYLGDKKLTEIPYTIGNLKNLSSLILWFNELTEVPNWIGNLINLSKLYLNNNKITKIPSTIGKLINLSELNLPNNELTKITSTVGNLIKLKALDFSNNKITEIPSTIGNLTNLEYLDLGNNKITKIPFTIGNLTNLSKLSLWGNPIVHYHEKIEKLKKLLPKKCKIKIY